MKDPHQTTTSVQVISRMFSVLDVLRSEREALSLKLISERAELHPSTAHRILNDLAYGGFVERSGPGHYRLGLGLLGLGQAVRDRMNVADLAAATMMALHGSTGCSTFLFVQQHADAVCIRQTLSGRNGIQVSETQSPRSPLTEGAAGKLLLLNYPEWLLEAICLQRNINIATMQKELQTIRDQGIATESDPTGHRAQIVAAPVLDNLRNVVACLAISYKDPIGNSDFAMKVKTSAKEISGYLGLEQISEG